MSEMDEIVGEFLVESYENLDQLDRDLVTLEQEPNSRGILSSIFRTIHTIKGTCGFLGFNKLEAVAHQGESLLSRLRDGVLTLTPERTTALLQMVDAVREILSAIEQTATEGDGDYSALVEELIALQAAEDSPATTAPVEAQLEEAVEEEATAPVAETKATVSLDTILLQPQAKKPAAVDLNAILLTPATAPNADAKASTPTPVIALKQAESPVAKAETPDAAAASGTNGEAGAAHGSVADSSIRVDVAQLDKLMNLVGELVLARNQILQFTTKVDDSAFLSTTQRLNLITSELQEGVMKTRMQPIGNVWSKFPRVVRDLSLQLGKNIRLEMEGKDTELDKTILEAIKDPLTHVVRNTVDHGIETPDIRLERGKPAEGVLTLRAFHEGGQVIIEIADDGAGLAIEKIKAKALERSLITSDQAARMNDREASQLIWLPGFSTADKVTNVSGRGVGMDVVKTNIERIGGSVDVTTEPGAGTTFRIKIPLTLAIIPALTITCSERRYAIPQVNLLELVRIEGEQARKGVEMIHGVPVYRLRGNLLPLVDLAGELHLKPGGSPALGLDPSTDEVNIVVLQADDRQFGLVVDGVNDTEEIVVKPLSQQIKDLNMFSGATIMGDGSVALILDVMGIAQNASVIAEVADRRSAEVVDTTEREDFGDRETLLVFAVGESGRMAIPLDDVDRLEEFSPSDVEMSGGRAVVQYRGEIMALLPLTEIMGGVPTPAGPMLPVVVYSNGNRSIGLRVDRILDIVENAVIVRQEGSRHGLIGSAVIQGRVTDLVDARTVVESFDPLFFAETAALVGQGSL